jgi:2'-5' RNA ligase
VAGEPDFSGYCMIALYPPADVAAALAIDDGLDPAEIHCTIAYTGNAADVDPELLNAAAAALASRAPVEATVSGHARFTGDDEQDVIVALADAAALDELRGDALGILAAAGIEVPRDHGYTAHLSMAYVDAADPDPVGRLDAFPVTFAAITAKHGKDRTDYPFTGTAAPLEAFTNEATLILGQLDGVWAVVFDRRDKKIARHTRKILAAWKDCAATLDIRHLVRDYRHWAGLAADLAVAVATADLAAFTAGWLRAILTRPGYQDLADAVADAVRVAMAEGEAAALALAAAQAGHEGFAIAAAYRDAYKALAALAGLDELAADWAERMITGAGTDVARRLAKLAAEGAAEREMVAQAERVLLRECRSPRFYAGEAMHTGFAHGAIALYQAEGVPELSWVTAGDTRVCSICDGYEADSPFLIGEFPEMPAHGGCRCMPVPSAEFAPARLADYLTAA